MINYHINYLRERECPQTDQRDNVVGDDASKQSLHGIFLQQRNICNAAGSACIS